MSVNRCISKIEFGIGIGDVRIFLDDGSELVGISRVSSKTQFDAWGTFQIDGCVMSGAGINPKPEGCQKENA